MNNARIFIFFFLFTIIGTLTHECGHVIAGALLGLKTSLSYAYTHCLNCLELNHATTNAHELALYEHKMALFTLGGPLQTLFTSLVGVIGLVLLSRKQLIDVYNTKHLFWITLSYFISRQVFNSVGVFYKYFVTHKWSYRSDESHLFTYFNIPQFAGFFVMLLISSAILAWVTFGIVKQHSTQLIIWGLLGSMLGAAFWLLWAGHVLMP